MYICSDVAGGSISRHLCPQSIGLRDDPEENRGALFLNPRVARLGGSGNTVPSRHTQIPAQVRSGYRLQSPGFYHDPSPPKLHGHLSSMDSLAFCLSSAQKPLLSPYLGSYRTTSRQFWLSRPSSSKVSRPTLTPLISPACCLLSQAALLLLWPQARELPSAGSLADPTLPSAPSSPSHL